jgi:hypothetical protein
MKISKRVRVLATIAGSGIVVASSGACGVDSTAPDAPSAAPQERVSSFVPSQASKTLSGLPTGAYTITFNPAVDQHLVLGPNRLDIPANAVCRLGSSGYGAEYWDRPCTPETKTVTLTVTVTNGGTDQSSVDFLPALRFNPLKNVTLNFYVPSVTKSDVRNWVILYCPSSTSGTSGSGSGGSGSGGGKKCVNEALADHDLNTFVDHDNSVLFRRIKHFSVYRVDAGYLATE